MAKEKCSLCSTEFDPEEEGINGVVGILPVKLCQICYHGMIDMVEKLEANANIECPECGHGIRLKVNVVP
jgi:DNA-directed RNA polymerase subunit RPC12/RpoP